MADDAFALSPISARASMPTEADYEAICGAFMETARGRWFLGEYAKRNRNADTRMVLDAIERIEATLASQKAATGLSLVDLLPAIAALIVDAERRILDALPKSDSRPATEPIQRAAGILRDVAWTLRESGADTRVCDLLDVQAKAIVDGCTRMQGDQTNASDVRAAVAAALEALTRQISALAGVDVPPAPSQVKARAHPEPTTEALREEAPATPSQAEPAPAATLDVVAPDQPPAAAQQAIADASEPATPDAPEATSERQLPPQASMTMVEVDVQANLWEDLEITETDANEALARLAAVADHTAAKPPPVPVEAKPAEPVPAAAALQSSEPAPVVVDAPCAVTSTAAEEPPAAAAAPELSHKPAPTSLGQAALDGGAVAPASGRYSEALAPIRRMSQAEKVAFFS
jgi:hypothetical protein